MKYTYKILTFSLLTLLVLACEDPYNDSAGPGDYVDTDKNYQPTGLDNWLYSNFTSPYNIEVKYRWDASELNLYKTLVPPVPSKVQEVMEVASQVWIKPYVELAGAGFIKEYCPKQFMLVGSPEYNFDGTIKLGTAEGGRKVVLYVVNDFLKTDQFSVKQLIHTIEHEFAHILHQSIMYPAEFKELTPGEYTANWNMVSLAEARARGFITSYAMSSPDEDFVEMISMMLIEGKEGYEAILECETTAASRQILREKEQLVVKYFIENYGIDFYELQTKVQESIEAIAPGDGGGGGESPQPIHEVWGFDKTYKALNYDFSTLPQPADFAARYNYDNQKLHEANYALDYNFKLHYSFEGELTLTLFYYSINSSEREYYTANFYFFVVRNDDGTLTLHYASSDDNGAYLQEGLQATGLLSFFANRTFKVDWVESCDGELYVGLFPADSPEKYAIATLGN